ncbi:MAG: hypothetical protein V2I97_16055 [Desulfococcaceae bacterium]|jgi:hypothetical protein|nr:hypothetical protein [Desulfococcaceae bacterium]
MKKFLILFFLLIPVTAFAGEKRFFDQFHNEVSEAEYNEIISEWYAALNTAPATSPPAVIQDKPLLQPLPAVIATEQIPKDSYGRPLKDKNGRWITYPGNEGAGSTMRGMYSTSTLPDLDMTRDVHVKGHWRTNKSGTRSWVRPHTRSKGN